MELYILRHGLAFPRGSADYPNDNERPLTSKGTRAMRRIAKTLRSRDLSFDHVFSSPLVRAKQTAEIVLGVLAPDHPITYSAQLAPEGDREMFINELLTACQPSDRALVIGHEPYLSGLISFLVCGDDAMGISLKKGGMCKLEIESLRIGKCAVLEWLLTPKQLQGLR